MRFHLLHLLSLLLLTGCSAQPRPFSAYDTYYVRPATETKANYKWSIYLHDHLRKRCGQTAAAGTAQVVCDRKPAQENCLSIVTSLDQQLPSAWRVERQGDELRLAAREPQTMLWLEYQLISAVGDDDLRFDVDDLPPAVVDFLQSGERGGDFAFEYRGIYSPTNADEEMLPVRGTHHVDYDWGLWGHNLRKVFPSGAVPYEAQAEVNGSRTGEQFCLSSQALYEAYVAFVLEEWGEGSDTQCIRFAVMPNDNALVCQCERCRRAGNTATCATPAAAALVRRLCERFPHHQFFTSSYSSTAEPLGLSAARPLPSNAGVLMSAMGLPMAPDVASRAETKGFTELFRRWQAVCPRIYVWDYTRNFDDYLTPYPCLHLLQTRLLLYKQLGVRGVFLNGSGELYATLDDLQTAVLSSLLCQPEADVDDLVSRYLQRAYPATGQLLTDYYIRLEGAERGSLPTYGGIAQAVKAGLDPEAFTAFVAELDKASKQADGEERSRLNQLLTALSFTRLELMRLPSAPYRKADIDEATALLSEHTAFADMDSYREAHGLIDDYLAEWKKVEPWTDGAKNLLYRLPVKALTPLDEDYQETACLTDGRHGFTTDYHTGWLLYSGREALRLQLPGLPQEAAGQLTLTFMQAPQWRIRLPQRVALWQGGRELCAAQGERRVSLSTAGLKSGQPFELRIERSEPKSRGSLALDELHLSH